MINVYHCWCEDVRALLRPFTNMKVISGRHKKLEGIVSTVNARNKEVAAPNSPQFPDNGGVEVPEYWCGPTRAGLEY